VILEVEALDPDLATRLGRLVQKARFRELLTALDRVADGRAK